MCVCDHVCVMILYLQSPVIKVGKGKGREQSWWVEGALTCSLLSGVQVGFLLGLPYVLLISDPLVAEPVGDLREGQTEV